MSTISEITVARAPATAESEFGAVTGVAPTGSWSSVDLPRARRPSPVTLAVLALLAGIGAIALGALAVVSATRAVDEPAVAPAPTGVPTSPVEQRVLALLAKPSTERVVVRGSGGRLVLAVGSGGRAALLVRGLEPAAKPYYAWVVTAGVPPKRAARLTGAERAVFLSVSVARGDRVVVATQRATALRPNSARLVATFG